MVIGGWGLGIRPRSCGPDAGRGRYGVETHARGVVTRDWGLGSGD